MPFKTQMKNKLHKGVYRPYRPMISWVFNELSVINSDEDNYDGVALVQLTTNCSVTTIAHEVAHYLFELLTPEQIRLFSACVVDACDNIGVLLNSITHDNFCLYAPITDAYSILNSEYPGCIISIAHELGYGKSDPVYYAAAECWATLCAQIFLNIATPVELFKLRNQVKLLLKWIDKNKVYHRKGSGGR
jgi:hypothetical protein